MTRTQTFLRTLSTILCLACLCVAFEGTAHAYADPGSGLMALQILGSTLAGVGFYFRQKLGRFFVRRNAPVVAENEALAARETPGE